MKTYSIKSLIFVLVIMAVVSCKNNPTKSNGSSDSHNSQNSLDWPGTYSGITPCADCDGIYTELMIDKNMNYQLITTYLDKGDEKSDTLSGTFMWEGSIIKLSGIAANSRPDRFKIEEGQVRSLDMEGNEITGELTNNYLLKKNGNKSVEDKKWQIVELMGKPIKGNGERYYIIFHSADGRLEAKANCNIISYAYKIKNDLQLSLVQGISTLMACDGNDEAELIKALNQADNLSISNRSLTINKARMAPLAKFELVAN